ncbi:LysR family transcriptional regulator [Mangrovicoccus ximenensis]|uniref:LysR family transcriptional regulator n=1 Tax=Mangrovicoccus ximenensis TaxID=1911570 RepID=UPI000D348EF2|nr:LysR family transcriptional regulator [Mangrovicoccus ximenensis]
MDWDDARMFLAVAREGQLLGAAKRLGVNQATLSRRLTHLERDLQATLMLRGPQGCALTGEGQALMARLERAEAAMQEGEALFRIPATSGCCATWPWPMPAPENPRWPPFTRPSDTR